MRFTMHDLLIALAFVAMIVIPGILGARAIKNNEENDEDYIPDAAKTVLSVQTQEATPVLGPRKRRKAA